MDSGASEHFGTITDPAVHAAIMEACTSPEQRFVSDAAYRVTGTKDGSLSFANNRDYTPMIRAMLDRGVDPNVEVMMGTTLLRLAYYSQSHQDGDKNMGGADDRWDTVQGTVRLLAASGADMQHSLDLAQETAFVRWMELVVTLGAYCTGGTIGWMRETMRVHLDDDDSDPTHVRYAALLARAEPIVAASGPEGGPMTA